MKSKLIKRLAAMASQLKTYKSGKDANGIDVRNGVLYTFSIGGDDYDC